jgi:hypothetical protein
MLNRPIDDLVLIAAVGGGFHIDDKRPIDDLVKIAAAASAKQARIIIHGASKRPIDDLVRIAAAGRGAIVFAD